MRVEKFLKLKPGYSLGAFLPVMFDFPLDLPAENVHIDESSQAIRRVPGVRGLIYSSGVSFATPLPNFFNSLQSLSVIFFI